MIEVENFIFKIVLFTKLLLLINFKKITLQNIKIKH